MAPLRVVSLQPRPASRLNSRTLPVEQIDTGIYRLKIEMFHLRHHFSALQDYTGIIVLLGHNENDVDSVM